MPYRFWKYLADLVHFILVPIWSRCSSCGSHSFYFATLGLMLDIVHHSNFQCQKCDERYKMNNKTTLVTVDDETRIKMAADALQHAGNLLQQSQWPETPDGLLAGPGMHGGPGMISRHAPGQLPSWKGPLRTALHLLYAGNPLEMETLWKEAAYKPKDDG